MNIDRDGSSIYRRDIITGGMGYYDNKSNSNVRQPLFVTDENWFIRKPAHLGKGVYTDIERRLYLSQWPQHEFMHHVFIHKYPEYSLEKSDHQWFQRSNWPRGFQGNNGEPDYYQEAIHKRILTSDASLIKRMKPNMRSDNNPDSSNSIIDSILGDYEVNPVRNQWHEVTMTKIDNQTVLWSNKAGRKRNINIENGKLYTEGNSPYKRKEVVVKGNQSGDVIGIIFNGELYKLKSQTEDNSNIPTVKDSIEGRYQRRPSTNGWHNVRITREGSDFRWTNDANASWLLYKDGNNFKIESDSPYGTRSVQVKRDRNQKVEYIIFGNERYYSQ